MTYGRRRAARSRRRGAGGDWRVQARVERFSEPAVLLLLAEHPAHGYELLEALPRLLSTDRVDIGNLYRALRALEEDGLVHSEWHADLPGPAKRTYQLTGAGRDVLEEWVVALARARDDIDSFLTRAHSIEGVRHEPDALL